MNTVYQLKKNNEIITEGSFLDCWKELIFTYGEMTVLEVTRAGVTIAPRKEG